MTDVLSPKSAATKRQRTSWQQKNLLEKIYETNQYPDLALRTQLGSQVTFHKSILQTDSYEKLSMTPRKIQIWFQNKRMKDKNKKSRSGSGSDSPSRPDSPQDYNSSFICGNTVLCYASFLGFASVVESLLSKGAKPNIPNEKGTNELINLMNNTENYFMSTNQ